MMRRCMTRWWWSCGAEATRTDLPWRLLATIMLRVTESATSTVTVDEVVCSKQGCRFSFGPYPSGMEPTDCRAACPECASYGRTVRKALTAELQIRASLEYGGFPAGTTAKRHRFAWGLVGWDYSLALGRLVQKVSLFDKRADRRYEHVEDPVTGAVLLHHRHHPLTQHRGHGSAKVGRL